MRKFTLTTITFFSVLFGTFAQTLNNPKDADGYYIVKYDCAAGAFATSNNIEVDQTFTFAVDVTGTPWENWLKGTPTAAGQPAHLPLINGQTLAM